MCGSLELNWKVHARIFVQLGSGTAPVGQAPRDDGAGSGRRLCLKCGRAPHRATGSRNLTLALTFVTVFALLVTEAWGATDLGASYLRRQVQRAQRKIHHVVIIMQENRSFDHYFGTF